jgi:HNH endonuclease
MRIKDIKLLWGRSGNRCAICKIELSPNGSVETIGEIAHIVSRTREGPRGNEALPLSKRDDYSNLMLLCPNHHSEIDKLPDSWPSSKLHQLKEEHEKWVSEQLEHGVLSFKLIDNSQFLENVYNSWVSFSKSKIWIVASLTPLRVDDDSVDPLDEAIIETLNNIHLPGDGFWVSHLNVYDTRPDENGITNIKTKNLKEGDGHKISIYRNGHCEFLFCLEGSVNSMTEYAKDKEPNIIGTSRIINYTHLAEVIIKQIRALQTIWNKCLQFKNMTLTITILNVRNSMLYSRENDPRGALYGYPVQTDNLQYSFIVDKDFQFDYLIDIILKRFVNYFGLVLHKILDVNGKLVRPEKI